MPVISDVPIKPEDTAASTAAQLVAVIKENFRLNVSHYRAIHKMINTSGFTKPQIVAALGSDATECQDYLQSLKEFINNKSPGAIT